MSNTMTREQVQKIVHKVITDTVFIKNIQNNAELTSQKGLDLDFIDCLSIVMNCEKEFGIQISNPEMATIRTVNDIINIVHNKKTKIITTGISHTK